MRSDALAKKIAVVGTRAAEPGENADLRTMCHSRGLPHLWIHCRCARLRTMVAVAKLVDSMARRSTDGVQGSRPWQSGGRRRREAGIKETNLKIMRINKGAIDGLIAAGL